MLSLQWPIINFVTIVLYASILIFLLLNPTLATIMLFALVAFWSRLPGVGTPPPGEWLILLDVVDIFSMIIAINIGGINGAVFSLCVNFGSRIVGSFPSWMVVIKDIIAQFVVCLFIPYIHILVGKNILVSMFWYSILRMLMFFPLRILPTKYPFHQFVIIIVSGGIAQTIVNGIYASIFGNFFDHLLQKGVKFNWILFIFVSIIIFGTKYYLKIKKIKK